MRYHVREATTDDGERMLKLLPRLASFDVPERRTVREVWSRDQRQLQAWLAGEKPDTLVHVAVDPDDRILAVAMTTIGEEFLSGKPSAHLEVLAVAAEAEGKGIGGALIARAEQAAMNRGASSITLNVFRNNARARRLYEKLGYDGEIIRYIKDLS